MPPPNPVVHVQQIVIGFCLPACAEMALIHLGVQTSQKELGVLFMTRVGIGTPFSRISLLAESPLQVQVIEWAGEESLRAALSENKVVIATVLTSSGLPGWEDVESQHALYLTAMDDDRVIYHDPALAYGPVTASLGEFLLAWSEMAEQVAFISRRHGG